MKICISGSAGLIGSWIVEHLLKKGHKIISFDNFIGGYRDSIIEHPNHEFYELNITDYSLIPKMADLMRGCDVVYHTAALAHEGFSIFAPSAIVSSVITGTVAIGTAAIRANVKRFINCSSMSRYGNSEPPFYEWMEINPVDPYGLAKSQAEQQLNMLGDLHGMDIIHSCPHMVIGKRQKYTDPYRNVVSIMTNLMLQGRKPVIYGDGLQTRCFSMIQDDVEIYEKFLDYDLKEQGEIFNIGPDDEEITILEAAEIISEELDIPLDVEWHSERPGELRRPFCSSDKIRDVFDFKPKTNLRDGIRSVIGYIKQRGPRPFEYHIELEIDNKSNIPKTWKEKLF